MSRSFEKKEAQKVDNRSKLTIQEDNSAETEDTPSIQQLYHCIDQLKTYQQNGNANGVRTNSARKNRHNPRLLTWIHPDEII